MNSTILSPPPLGPPVLSCATARVYVDGRRDRELEVLEWEALPAPVFGKAVVAVAELDPAGPCRRLGDPDGLPPIGSQITIDLAGQTGAGQFIGRVSAHSLVVREDGERFVAECRHQLALNLTSR